MYNAPLRIQLLAFSLMLLFFHLSGYSENRADEHLRVGAIEREHTRVAIQLGSYDSTIQRLKESIQFIQRQAEQEWRTREQNYHKLIVEGDDRLAAIVERMAVQQWNISQNRISENEEKIRKQEEEQRRNESRLHAELQELESQLGVHESRFRLFNEIEGFTAVLFTLSVILLFSISPIFRGFVYLVAGVWVFDQLTRARD